MSQPSRLYISSDDRVPDATSSPSLFSVQLARPIINPQTAELGPISVPLLCDSPSVPFYESKFWLNFKTTATGAIINTLCQIDTSIEYTLASLVVAINKAVSNAIDLATGKSAFPSNKSPITFSLLSATQSSSNKIRFDVTAGTTVQIVGFGGYNNKSSPYYNTLMYRLGFACGTNSPFCQNLEDYRAAGLPWGYPSVLRTSCIYIESSLTQGDNMTSSNKYDILAKVNVGSQSWGQVIANQGNTAVYYYTIRNLPQQIDKITFRLLDENFVQLDASDSCMASNIELMIRYDKDDVNVPEAPSASLLKQYVRR
jgi:hypothetical protein